VRGDEDEKGRFAEKTREKTKKKLQKIGKKKNMTIGREKGHELPKKERTPVKIAKIGGQKQHKVKPKAQGGMKKMVTLSTKNHVVRNKNGRGEGYAYSIIAERKSCQQDDGGGSQSVQNRKRRATRKKGGKKRVKRRREKELENKIVKGEKPVTSPEGKKKKKETQGGKPVRDKLFGGPKDRGKIKITSYHRTERKENKREGMKGKKNLVPNKGEEPQPWAGNKTNNTHCKRNC